MRGSAAAEVLLAALLLFAGGASAAPPRTALTVATASDAVNGDVCTDQEEPDRVGQRGHQAHRRVQPDRATEPHQVRAPQRESHHRDAGACVREAESRW